jgi:hypothetical protein
LHFLRLILCAQPSKVACPAVSVSSDFAILPQNGAASSKRLGSRPNSGKRGFHEQLRCPTCHRTGSAALSQEDDDHVPVADRIPDGFEVITTKYGIDFICTSCRIRVQP